VKRKHSYRAHAGNPVHRVDIAAMNSPEPKASSLLEISETWSDDKLPTYAELRQRKADKANRPKWCPGCQHVVYNGDSPLSDHEYKLLRRQHRSLVLSDRDAPLHSEASLNKARVTVWQAERSRKRLMTKYPPPEDSLLQMAAHN